MRKAYTWTPEEEQLVRLHYPDGGAIAVQRALRNAGLGMRTRFAITQRAHKMRVGTRVTIRPGQTPAIAAELADRELESVLNIYNGLRVAIADTDRELRNLLVDAAATSEQIRDTMQEMEGFMERYADTLRDILRRERGDTDPNRSAVITEIEQIAGQVEPLNEAELNHG